MARTLMGRPNHRIVYTHGGGRLGNQIVRFVHWIAWVRSQASDIDVLNLAFWPYARFFASWRRHPGCVYPMRGGVPDVLARGYGSLPSRVQVSLQANDRLARAVQTGGCCWPRWQAIALNVAREESLDLDDPAFLEQVRRRRITTCSGWRIASWKRVSEQQAELRELFAPASDYLRPAAAFMAHLRERYDFLVGVMIRQTDYNVWEEGRFYFSTACYARWVREVLDIHPGKRTAFVIASEAWQDPALFEGMPCFQATGNPGQCGHWFEKWIELSLCDVIVSPPSTFSATAAFRGNVPLWPVAAAEQSMSISQVINDGMVGAARHPVFSKAVK